MLDLGMTFSLEQLVIDNDIIGMMKHVTEGIEVTIDTLGVDRIAEIGSGGDFTGHPDTFAKMNILSNPKVINRQMRGAWEADGQKNDVDYAHEVVMDILENHVTEPIEHQADCDKVVKMGVERYHKLAGD